MSELTRREFLGAAALGASLSVMGLGKAKTEESAGKPFKTELHKGFICETADEEIFRAHAEAGFEGVELKNRNQTDSEIQADLNLAKDYAFRIHSIMGGGGDFTSDDPAVRAAGQERIRTAIRAASLYGADTVLLSPGRIREKEPYPIPHPQELKICFDPDTLQIASVTDGDHSPYRAYIEDHNRAVPLIFGEIEKLIPVAAYYGVIVAIENVWNHLWLQPEIFAATIRKFDDLWVKAYFDMGNHARFAPTSDWLRALGKGNIAKLHLKDFAIEYDHPNQRYGRFCAFGTGSIDWTDVRNTIEEIGYNGWVSYEEEVITYTPNGHAKRMDQWIKGEPIEPPTKEDLISED